MGMRPERHAERSAGRSHWSSGTAILMLISKLQSVPKTRLTVILIPYGEQKTHLFLSGPGITN